MLERVFQEPKFRVRCLGGFQIIETGSPADLTPASRKVRALIGYLCIVGKPVSRERLASLLWGDRGDEQARASLRQAIYELRSALGGEHLLKVERDTIGVSEEVVTDVATILVAAQSGNLRQLADVISEWRGDFFEDLPSIDPAFDAWLQSERVQVQESLIEAAADAVKAGMAEGAIDQARKVVNLLQQRDGTNEFVVRLGLQLDRLAGDAVALHRRYERFRDLLKAELDVAPSLETQRLFKELTSITSTSPVAASPLPSSTRLEPIECEDAAVSKFNSSQPFLHATPEPGRTTCNALRPVRSRYWMGLAAIVLGAVCVGVLAWFGWKPTRETVAAGPELRLAVLPFQSLSAGPGSRQFSDGMSADIRDALRRRQIPVISPPSTLNDGNASAPKALSATHVLSGSVERTGQRIRVITQLMNIQDNRVIWNRVYEGALTRTPTLRQDLAQQIAGAVGRLLSVGPLATAPHVSPAAFEHYSRGRALFRRRNLIGSVAELEAATRLAPGFADAWSTLAAVRWFLAASTSKEQKGRYELSMVSAVRSPAQRALALNPNNGEAIGVLAMLLPATKLQEIDRQLERALRLEPHNTQLLAWHGEFLMFVGRNHEALDELTRAYELDRDTPSVTPNLVLVAMRTGRFEEAKEITEVNMAHDIGLQDEFRDLKIKSFLYRHDWFGLANYLNAASNRASPQTAAFFRLCRESAIALGTREHEKFRPLRAGWRTAAAADPDDAVQFLSAFGDADGALGALQGAVRSRQKDELFTDPEWEALFVPDLLALRRDPRVPKLLASWGLFDYWREAKQWPDFMY